MAGTNVRRHERDEVHATPIEPRPSVADAILRTLAANGVTHLFGVPGGPLAAMNKALSRQRLVRWVLAKHEEGAAFMALGYAQAGHRLGAVCATTGPGATNALTGVASATSDSAPVLLVTAQVATSSFGVGAVQDSSGGNWSLDLVDVYRSATKLSAMLSHPADLLRLTRHAVRTALDGRRGAVHLNVPTDLMTVPVPAGTLAVDTPATPVQPAPDRAAVANLARDLAAAHRPVILAGQGAKISQSHQALEHLAEWGRIPVATTFKGKSVFPEDHALSLGVFGIGGHPAAHEYLLSDEIDLILVIGSGLGEMSTHGWDERLFRGRRVCQIDIDPLQIGRRFPADIAVAGDANAALQMLLAELPTRTSARPDPLLGQVMAPSRRYYHSDRLQEGHYQLQASAVVARLSELLPADIIIFADNGNCVSWLGQYYQFRRQGAMFASFNMASMGYSLGAAIGGKIAQPDRPVVALVGDAAFAMNGMEVHTAVEYGVPVVWIVLNNGGHGMVHNGHTMAFNESYDALYRHPIDIAQVAQGLGTQSTTVDSLEGLDNAITVALEADCPYVIDVHVDPDQTPWGLRARVGVLQAVFGFAEPSPDRLAAVEPTRSQLGPRSPHHRSGRPAAEHL